MGARTLRLQFLLVPLLILTLPVLVGSAEDHHVKDRVSLQETVASNEIDGYLFTLKEGDKVSWTVNQVSGDNMDVLLMAHPEYTKLKTGTGTPLNYEAHSEENVQYTYDSLNATGHPWIGDFALVIRTTALDNGSTTYDITIKLEMAPEPQSLADRICALGAFNCLALSVLVVAVLLIIFYIAKRARIDEQTSPTEGRHLKYVDSMMRPGFDIPMVPTAHEHGPKKRRKKRGKGSKKKKRSPGRKKKKRKRASKVESMIPETIIECPNCGAGIHEGQSRCPSCASELVFDEVLECPVCGHSNVPGATSCAGCKAEFE